MYVIQPFLFCFERGSEWFGLIDESGKFSVLYRMKTHPCSLNDLQCLHLCSRPCPWLSALFYAVNSLMSTLAIKCLLNVY